MAAREDLTGRVELCCSGCGLAYAADPEVAVDDLVCLDCGCSVYAVELTDSIDFGTGDLAALLEDCVDCVASGEECRFHAGVAAGWDLAVAWMAQHVARERAGELDAGDELTAAVAEGRL
jgi:hypothetical protein